MTIRKLAEQSEVSIGTIYNLFDTKEDLITELIKDYWDKSIQKVLRENRTFKGNTLDRVGNLYRMFFETTNEFHSNWIQDLEGIRMTNKSIYKMSQAYLEIIINRVEEIILTDEFISNQFNDIFTSKRVAKLIHDLFAKDKTYDEEYVKFLRYSLEKLLNLN